MHRIINEINGYVKNRMEFFLKPYTQLTITGKDQFILQKIASFINNSQFFWNQGIYIEDDELVERKKRRIANEQFLPNEYVIYSLVRSYVNLKEYLKKELKINSVKEIKAIYPRHIFHPYMDLLEIIETELEKYLPSISLTSISEQVVSEIAEELTDYYKKNNGYYLKEARKFNRTHHANIKKIKLLLARFYELDDESTMYKNISFLRFKLEILEDMPRAIKLNILKQIQRTYTAYFNNNNIQAIRIIHRRGKCYEITFICLGVFKLGHFFDKARIEGLSNKLQDAFMALSKHISFNIDSFCTPTTFARDSELSSLGFIKSIYGICKLIIYSDIYVKMTIPHVDTFNIINLKGFKRLTERGKVGYE